MLNNQRVDIFEWLGTINSFFLLTIYNIYLLFFLYMIFFLWVKHIDQCFYADWGRSSSVLTIQFSQFGFRSAKRWSVEDSQVFPLVQSPVHLWHHRFSLVKLPCFMVTFPQFDNIQSQFFLVKSVWSHFLGKRRIRSHIIRILIGGSPIFPGSWIVYTII